MIIHAIDLGFIKKSRIYQFLVRLYDDNDPPGTVIRIIIVTIALTMMIFMVPLWFGQQKLNPVVNRIVDFYSIIPLIGGIYGIQACHQRKTFSFPTIYSLQKSPSVAVSVLYFSYGLMFIAIGMAWYMFVQDFLIHDPASYPPTRFGTEVIFVFLPISWLKGLDTVYQCWGTTLRKRVLERKWYYGPRILVGAIFYGIGSMLMGMYFGTGEGIVYTFIIALIFGAINILICLVCFDLERNDHRFEPQENFHFMRYQLMITSWIALTLGNFFLGLCMKLPKGNIFYFYDGSPLDFLFIFSLSGLSISLTVWVYYMRQQSIHAGDALLHPTISAFSPAEYLLIEWIALGYSNKEIAAKMGRSPKTVDRHIHDLFQKTGFTNRRDLQAYYLPAIQNHQNGKT